MAVRRNEARAAVALRLSGATYGEIADTLGLADAFQARNLVELDLASRPDDEQQRNGLRTELGARLDALLRSVWPKALNSSDPEHIVAVRTALSLVDRQARLYGADAPTEIVVHNPTSAEIDAWVKEVLELQARTIEVVDADIFELEAASDGS